jgi:oligopeptide transport system permease protein
MRKNRMAVFGAIALAIIAAASLIGPLVIAYGYEEQNLLLGAAPPSAAHPLGTDKLGRDQLARILYGGRVSLLVGIAATAVSLTIGLLWGSVAAYFGGKVDAVMMRIVDILYALPFTIFVILLMTVFGRNFVLLFVAIGAVEWLTMARIVRGQVLALKKQEFIEAAIALGLRKRRIILRHLIPNVLGPVAVYTTLTIPAVMLLEAFLSFLGLGVQPPMSSWGTADQGRRGDDGGSAVAAALPGRAVHADAVLAQLPRRRAARCAGCARVQGLAGGAARGQRPQHRISHAPRRGSRGERRLVPARARRDARHRRRNPAPESRSRASRCSA